MRNASEVFQRVQFVFRNNAGKFFKNLLFNGMMDYDLAFKMWVRGKERRFVIVGR